MNKRRYINKDDLHTGKVRKINTSEDKFYFGSSSGYVEDAGERVSKILSRYGIASRRQAELLIDKGSVYIDGIKIDALGTKVFPGQRICVDGNELSYRSDPTRLVLLRKKRGVITSRNDPQQRDTIYTHLPDDMQMLMPIGRLDFNSEGLLLMTNDGHLKRFMELPINNISRKYEVRVMRRNRFPKNEKPSYIMKNRATSPYLCEEDVVAIMAGIRVGQDIYRPVHCELLQDDLQQNCSRMCITLKEGKNREIRKILAYLGFYVTRLVRVSYGKFSLNEITGKEATEVSPGRLSRYFGYV